MSSAYRSAYDHIVGLKQRRGAGGARAARADAPRLREISRARWAHIVSGLSGVGAAIAMVWYAATATHRDENATYSLVFGFVRPRRHVGARAYPPLPLRSSAPPPSRSSRDSSSATSSCSTSATFAARRAIEAQADKLGSRIALRSRASRFLAAAVVPPLARRVRDGNDSARELFGWIRISLVIVGHAHARSPMLGYLFARKLHRATNEAITNLRIHREWAKIWLITIGVSCLPSASCSPRAPASVALTGIAFIPFMIAACLASLNERLLIARAFAIGSMQNERAYWELEPVRPRTDGRERPHVSAEEQQREPDRDDEHADADARDRAGA